MGKKKKGRGADGPRNDGGLVLMQSEGKSES